MNIIEVKEDTEMLAEINLGNSVIMCGLEGNSNKFYEYEDNRIYLLNKSDVMLQTQKMVGNTTIIWEYNPNIKWCVPKGVSLYIQEPRRAKPVFQNIFINHYELCNESEKSDIIGVSFTINIDKDRAKGLIRIPAGERILELDFDYTSFVTEPIETIYVLKNNYVFQEFYDHFNR